MLSNISSCYSASPYSPAAVVVSSLVDLIVPLVASLNTGPNVCPPSVLNLATGVSLVWFVSHHVTATSAPSAASSTLHESASVELLSFLSCD